MNREEATENNSVGESLSPLMQLMCEGTKQLRAIAES
jgi:hypothetical protein